MARIYEFATGEVIHDSPHKEPLLRRLIGRTASRANLKLTEESFEASEARVDYAARLGIAAYQARVDYMSPRSDMTQEEVLDLAAQAENALDELSPAERQRAAEFIRTVTINPQQEIS